MALHGHSAACCTIPPVQHEYEGKGEYIDVDGMRTYVTGPASAKKAILMIYDIFGFRPQTMQGADILAYAGTDEAHRYRVFMPDFFLGSPADLAWYPPDTEEKGAKLGNFFQTTANPAEAIKRVVPLVDALKAKNPGLESWGIVGLCWGGKIAALTTTAGTPFSVAASAHPAMVDAKDASAITVPFLMLPTKDENMDDVEAFEKALKVDKKVQPFLDQIHGFMGARGDLKDDAVVKRYQEGYQTVLEWFHKYL